MNKNLQDVDVNVVHPLPVPSPASSPLLSELSNTVKSKVPVNSTDKPHASRLEDTSTDVLHETDLQLQKDESEDFEYGDNCCPRYETPKHLKDNYRSLNLDQSCDENSHFSRDSTDTAAYTKPSSSKNNLTGTLSGDDKLLSNTDGLCIENAVTMGNQQTNRKTAPDDEDTPDESKTKCCQVPKKKVKDKAKRISRASRSDDLGFESDEVYPFDGRTRSESELNEPVELEPFEIVETDDIRFVPGAGTSDVIKSASEPKFTPIPEEVVIDDNDGQRVVESAENTDVKMFYFTQGHKIAESGTSTAHSTFEFKHVKPKAKLAVTKSDNLSEPLYENIHEGSKAQSGIPSTSVEDAAKSSSNESSKNVSRQNSREPIAKPVRKSKKYKGASEQEMEIKVSKENTSSKSLVEDESTEVKQIVKRSDQPSIRDSEIDRNIDSVLMLTQTMFSKLKKPEAEIEMPPEQSQPSDPTLNSTEQKYENVNVSVKFDSKGISIAHKDPKNDEKRRSKSSSSVKSTGSSDKSSVIEAGQPTGKYENVGKCAKFERTGISIAHKDDRLVPVVILSSNQDNDKRKSSKQSNKGQKDSDKKRKRKASDDKEFVQISRHNSSAESHGQGILHISDSGTLIIKADKLTDKTEENECTQECSETQSAVAESVQQKQERGMLHISDTGTLIIHSLPKPPAHAPSSERGRSHYYENDIINRDITDVKVPFEDTDSVTDEHESKSLYAGSKCEKPVLRRKDDSRDSESSVPPSSPSALDMLTEVLEEEEEEEENDEAFVEEMDQRKSLEMADFTESVCKRLSQLLEASDVNKEESENEDYLFESGTYGNYENIYETLSKSENNNQRDRKTESSSASYESEATSKQNLLSSACSKPSKEIKDDSTDSDVFDENPKSVQTSDDGDDDDMPEYFDPRKSETSTLEQTSSGNFESSNYFSTNDSFRSDKTILAEGTDSPQYECIDGNGSTSRQLTLPIRPVQSYSDHDTETQNDNLDDLRDKTPTMETVTKMPVSEEHATFDSTSRCRSVTCTESDIDTSEHRDDLSTDSMLADDEEEETMEILFTKTYTEPVEGAEVFLSCTVVNSAYKEENKKSDTWLSDEALEYFEANASEVMSTAFLKAKKEMKDIQACLQSLRKQMEHFHGDRDDISLPDIPVEHLSPDYFGFSRKAITD